MKKKIGSILLCLAVMFGVMAIIGVPTMAATHDHTGWTAWTSDNSLPDTAGNYYLTTNVTLSRGWTDPSGTTNLCLNGHTITIGSYAGNRIAVKHTLTITDCQPNPGKITTNATEETMSVASTGIFTLENGCIENNTTHDYAFYTTGNTTIKGGSITSNNQTAILCNQGSLHIQGGTISGKIGVRVMNTFYLSGNPAITGTTCDVALEYKYSTLHGSKDGIPYIGNPIRIKGTTDMTKDTRIVNDSMDTSRFIEYAGWPSGLCFVQHNDCLYLGTNEITDKYTVTWENANGNELETDNNVVYGTVATYNGTTPTMAPTAQYTYAFTGWDKPISGVTDNIIYTATYASTVNKYTVTWLDENGTELEKDLNVPYGETPSYNSATPTKANTAQYTYTFKGWDKAISNVTGNVTYKATYQETENTFDVILPTSQTGYAIVPEAGSSSSVSYDGSYRFKVVLDTGYHADNLTVKVNGTDLTAVGDIYTIEHITENKSITVDGVAINTYTVTWLDENGTELEKDENVPYGETPSYNGTLPTKAATAQYTYTFDTWSPAVSAVTGDVTYTASYSSTVNQYTITWIDGNGMTIKTEDIDYGTVPVYSGATPTKTATAQFTYTFKEWDTAPVAVTGDASYTATFDAAVNTYTVTWYDEDGNTVLHTDPAVPYGETPSYDGTTPTKAATAQYTYTFDKWTPDIAAVTGNVSYTASYSSTVNQYTVIWLDENGTELEKDENVPYGETPSYDGTTPTKAATAQYTYTFDTWSPAVSNVTGDITYTATYSSTVNQYTVTWLDENGTELEKDLNVPYGETPSYDGATPTKAATAQYTYTFDKWTPDIAAVTGDVTYTASYSSTVNQYTVTWLDEDGSELEKDENVPYGETPSYDGTTPTKPADAAFTYAFEAWSPAISPVTGNMTYTATYKATRIPPPITYRNDNFVTATGEFDEIAYYGREARAGDVLTLKVALSELGETYGLDFTKIHVRYEVIGAVQLGDNYLYTGNPLYKDGIATDFVLTDGFVKIVAHIEYNGFEAGSFTPFYANI